MTTKDSMEVLKERAQIALDLITEKRSFLTDLKKEEYEVLDPDWLKWDSGTHLKVLDKAREVLREASSEILSLHCKKYTVIKPGVINCHSGEQMFPNYVPEWREDEGVDHCNYCGSVRPERAASALVDGRATNIEWADLKYGWPHKLYLTIDGKWSKFYSIHLKDLPPEEFEKVRKVLIEMTGMDFVQDGDRLKWRRTTTGTQT